MVKLLFVDHLKNEVIVVQRLGIGCTAPSTCLRPPVGTQVLCPQTSAEDHAIIPRSPPLEQQIAQHFALAVVKSRELPGVAGLVGSIAVTVLLWVLLIWLYRRSRAVASQTSQ